MSDPFERMHLYVDALLNRKRPKRVTVDNEQDWMALQFAARLAGEAASDPEPSAAFVAALQTRVVVSASAPSAASPSRRGLLAAAMAGIAAGLGGFGLGRFTAPAPEPAPAPAQVASPSQPAMVREERGQWFAVAKLSQFSNQWVMRFTAGAVEGHLVRQGNKIYALSAICSHLPCSLVYQNDKRSFLCPCHDVSFGIAGEAINARRPYDPLTPIQVKIEGDDIMVLSIGEAPKTHLGTPQL